MKTPQKESSRKEIPKYDIRLLQEFPDLKKWLEEISRYNKIKDFVFISDYKKEELIRVKVYTKEHYYAISAHLPNKKKNGYLGCIGQVRKARAGEDWLRGNDLPDGSYSKETWDNIKNAIVAYEMVKVVRNSESK
jgi:hypothetical protein